MGLLEVALLVLALLLVALQVMARDALQRRGWIRNSTLSWHASRGANASKASGKAWQLRHPLDRQLLRHLLLHLLHLR